MTIEASTGGYFVIEGPHRSGKTTQRDAVAVALEEQGFPVLLLEEPPQGGLARAYVQQEVDRLPVIEALRMYADRVELLARVVVPAVASGEIVLCSRNYLSTFVLQGELGELGMKRIDDLHRFAMLGLPRPNAIFVLDTGDGTLETSRVSKGLLDGDQLERGMHERGRDTASAKAYRAYAASHPDEPVEFIDGTGSPETVCRRLLARINYHLSAANQEASRA